MEGDKVNERISQCINVPDAVEVVPRNPYDSSEYDTCQASTSEREVDPLGVPECEPEEQHLNTITLNIRIAIIRCFYSSSSCPTTALEMLKEEDDDLCVTISVEDINFFVQKFEKTGSVIDMDSPRTEDMVNPHSFVEAIVDSDNDMDYLEFEKHRVPKKRKRRNTGKKIDGRKTIHRFPPLGKHQCRICKKKCPDSPSFTYHFLSHFNMTFLSKFGPHKCPGCDREIMRAQNFYTHLFYTCRLKDYDFSQHEKNTEFINDSSVPDSASLSDISKEEGCLPTEQYSSSLQDQVEQSEHEANDNSSQSISENSSESPTKKVHKCPSCSEILPDKRSLTYHVAEHYDLDYLQGDPPYKCPAGCDRTFNKKPNVYKHLTSPCQNKMNRAPTPFNCHLCSRAFQFEIQLKHHILVHSGEAKSKVCSYCGKKFDTLTGFKYHLLSTHAETKAYQCDQCPRHFASLKLLEEHRLSHSGTCLFSCEVCGKQCDTSASLRSHTRRHAEPARQWQCHLCGKYYSGKDYKKNYQQHMRTHTQEIVGVCDLCGKGFNHKGNLKIHYKSCQRQMLGVNQLY